MSELEQILRREIEEGGPISFARFMEVALYWPGWGYYERAGRVLGRRGDYMTSVSVGPVFGALLAMRFSSWLEQIPEKEKVVLEAGAHDGQLAMDILSILRPKLGAGDSGVNYWIQEPSQLRRGWQKKKLEGWNVRWAESWQDSPRPFRGIIFANELLDAFPVRRFGWDANERRWFEWGVGWDGSEFEWSRLALAEDGGEIVDVPKEIEPHLPDGYVVERSIEAEEWWMAAAAQMEAGWLVAIDYGFMAEERLRPERRHGTLRAYQGQRVNDQLLSDVGRQDLTAHVNFSAIERAGERAGARTERLTTQAEFLAEILQTGERTWTSAERRQIQTLMHPEHMGRVFRVLVQSKGAHA